MVFSETRINITKHPIPWNLNSGNPDLDSPFTMKELNAALKASRQTIPGSDGNSVKFLKQLLDQHITTLRNLFNNIFDSGYLPPSGMLSTVIPIRKPGKSAYLVKCYRPIALTSFCRKLLERILLRHLLPWRGQQRIFPPDHFGFLPTRDCTSVLSAFLCDILGLELRNSFWRRLPRYTNCV